jgi:effector-binding domain-containing protein
VTSDAGPLATATTHASQTQHGWQSGKPTMSSPSVPRRPCVTDRIEPELVDVEATSTAVIRGVVPVAELAAFFDRSFATLASVTSTQGAEVTGPAFALYHGQPGETVDLEVGFPTAETVRPDGDVEPGALPEGRVARLLHCGSYDGLGASWERLQAWIVEQGHQPGPVLWEVYVTKPSPNMDPADLRTELIWPVAT